MVDAELAAAVVPYIGAAAAVYGAAVVERVWDTAADATVGATVGLGRRLLRLILRREEAATQVIATVQDLAQDPADEDRIAAARLQIRKALAADPRLAVEVADMLEAAGVSVTASGARSVAVRDNSGIIQTGDDSSAWQQRQP